MIHWLKRFPGGENGNPLQHSCLEKSHGQRSMVGYSPQGYEESDTTEHAPVIAIVHFPTNFEEFNHPLCILMITIILLSAYYI